MCAFVLIMSVFALICPKIFIVEIVLFHFFKRGSFHPNYFNDVLDNIYDIDGIFFNDKILHSLLNQCCSCFICLNACFFYVLSFLIFDSLKNARTIQILNIL